MEHGATFAGTLRYSDDLDVEIAVTVKRRVAPDDRALYVLDAMSVLRREPGHTCTHSKATRGPFRLSKTTGCGGMIAGVIVYRSRYTSALPPGHFGPVPRTWGFDFVCSVHRDHPRYAAPDIIEIIGFTTAQREQLRRAHRKHKEEWYAECRKRDAIDDENDKRAAQGLPRLDGGWNR